MYNSILLDAELCQVQGEMESDPCKKSTGNWVKCSYARFQGTACQRLSLDRNFSTAILTCQRYNAFKAKHVAQVFCWTWQHQNEVGSYFQEIWSNTSQMRYNFVWQPNAGPWRCEYRIGGHIMLMGPLENEDTLCYHAPSHKKTWDGPFPNGTWALKGHYWICGQYAYRRLT